MGRPVSRQPLHRLRRRAAPVAVAIVTAALVGSAASGALAEGQHTPSGELSDFELGGTAGLVDFKFSYPNLVLPYVVTGGVLESFSLAAGTGRAQGWAGFLPVPIATSGALLIPTNDPILGQPIPEEVRTAAKSIDFSGFPNQCQSDYPAVGPGGDERYCGGPAAEDARLGFTAAMLNGHTKSSGTSDDPLTSAAESTSRGTDVNIPAMQTTIHGGWSKATSRRNGDGIPESRSELEIDGLAVLTGLIRIDGVRSEAVASSDGTNDGVTTSSAFNVREVRVAGVPVIVGRDGVTVNTEALVPGTVVKQATDAVTAALKQNDVQIRLVPAPPPEHQGPQVSVQSGGIEIVHKGTTVTPADSIYRIGFTSARASATRSSPSDELGGVLPGSSDSTSGSTGGSSVTNSISGGTGVGDLGGSSGSDLGSSGDTSAADSAGGGLAAGDFSSPSSSGGAGTDLSSVSGSATTPSGARRATSGAANRTATVAAASISRLPSASVKYVFAVFVGLILLGACAVPLRR